MSSEKDVLLDYYTQWYGQCKATAPTYEKLAALYAEDLIGRHKVTIAKTDAEANDVPGNVRGFPTFKLFPAGEKERLVFYDGLWTVEGFAGFVRDRGIHRVNTLLEKTNNLTTSHTEHRTTQ